MSEKAGKVPRFPNKVEATLRDYFAALAMQAILSDKGAHNESIPEGMDDLAKLAYRQADAMLAAR